MSRGKNSQHPITQKRIVKNLHLSKGPNASNDPWRSLEFHSKDKHLRIIREMGEVLLEYQDTSADQAKLISFKIDEQERKILLNGLKNVETKVKQENGLVRREDFEFVNGRAAVAAHIDGGDDWGYGLIQLQGLTQHGGNFDLTESQYLAVKKILF